LDSGKCDAGRLTVMPGAVDGSVALLLHRLPAAAGGEQHRKDTHNACAPQQVDGHGILPDCLGDGMKYPATGLISIGVSCKRSVE